MGEGFPAVGAFRILEQLSMRQLGTRDEAPAGLTPMDIAWIEQRLAVTLTGNDIACKIENGFLTISGPNGTSDPISLAPLVAQLTKIDRSQWSGYAREWCVQTLHSPAHTTISATPVSSRTGNNSEQVTSRLDVEAQIEDLMFQPAEIDGPALQPTPAASSTGPDGPQTTLAEILAANTRSASTGHPTDPISAEVGLTASIDLDAVEEFDVEHALQHTLEELDAVSASEITVEPSTPAVPMAATAPLADVIGDLSVRLVSEAVARTMPAASLIETSVPNMYAALSSGHGRWILPTDLEAWGITRAMALEMAETRVLALSPDVTIVLLDDSTPVYVVETSGPDIASLLPYVDVHVPVAPGAEVTVALANDHLMFIHVSSDERPTDCMQLLIDASTAEYSQRPGMASPAVFAWSTGGALTSLVSSLQTAAGRLSARAFVGAAV